MGIKIIAEAGVNHNGSMELAKKMVDKAYEAGADYIKFQTFQPQKLVSKYAGKAEYQKRNTNSEESQLEMLKKLALTQENFRELQEYCRQVGIGFVSTPFDMESIDFLESLDMDFWKIPSGEITNLPYLIKIARTGRPIVMSTGMCCMEEIQEALTWLNKNGAGEITLLHCNTQYPTPMEDVNLNVLKSLRQQFHLPVGYSDHTEGIEVTIAAAALGAVVLEKHFTLDKNMEGPDHKASLEPEELKAMVTAVHRIEKSLGSCEKRVTPSESANRTAARKSIVAKGKIRKGEQFGEDNLTVKRPGNGISPMKWFEILGKTATRDYLEDEMISEEELS